MITEVHIDHKDAKVTEVNQLYMNRFHPQPEQIALNSQSSKI